MQSPSARLKRPRTQAKLEIIMPCKMCGYKDSRFFSKQDCRDEPLISWLASRSSWATRQLGC